MKEQAQAHYFGTIVATLLFNFYFPFFVCMVMHDNELKTKENKNWTKDKIEPQQLFLFRVYRNKRISRIPAPSTRFKQPSHVKPMVANSCWQTQIGVCEQTTLVRYLLSLVLILRLFELLLKGSMVLSLNTFLILYLSSQNRTIAWDQTMNCFYHHLL